jgi:prepilin-type processing-associated H-X9-DG protein/prepilin-type N-terminal cleavage/methylation domain-containing protein
MHEFLTNGTLIRLATASSDIVMKGERQKRLMDKRLLSWLTLAQAENALLGNGIIARRKARHITVAFTLLELLVTIGIIGILAALILAAIASAKRKGQRAVCLNNMHEIGLASEMYCGENHDVIVPMARHVVPYPTASLIVPYAPNVWWPDTLRPLVQSGPKVFSCPNVPPVQADIRLTNVLGIGMNFNELGLFPDNPDPKTGRFVTTTMVAKPSETIIFGDAAYVKNPKEKIADLWVANTERQYTWQGFGVWLFEVPNARKNQWMRNPVRVINRHDGNANCAFVDGHAVAMKTSQLGWQFPKGSAGAMWDR